MSHARHWRGHPFRCVELARAGQIRAVTCAEILSELAEKLPAKLSFTTEQTDETLADYLSFHVLVGIPGVLNAVPRDAEDNAVLECAQAGSAQFIVTGDQDLLSLNSFRGVEIVTSAEFERRWQAGEIARRREVQSRQRRPSRHRAVRNELQPALLPGGVSIAGEHFFSSETNGGFWR